MKNPKTTVLGVITIALAVLTYVAGTLDGHPVDLTTTIASITAGIGLITAHDSK